MLKKTAWIGTALDDLRAFPKNVRQDIGHQLDRVQRGLRPTDSKPMTVVGPGAAEIRVQSEDGAYRVLYVAKFKDVIVILHCFNKKTQKTSARDLEIGRRRYEEARKTFS